MKLLKVTFDGLEMFKHGKLTLDFFATDRVVDLRGVTPVEKPIYSENVVAFAGINASGKTTTLRLAALAINLLSGGSVALSLQAPCFALLDVLKIDALFYHNGAYYRLASEIEQLQGRGLYAEPAFVSEMLWEKKGSIVSKKVLEDPERFSSEAALITNRNDLPEQVLDFLPDSVSIVSALTKGDRPFASLAVPSDAEWLRFEDKPLEDVIAKAFDKSIGHIDIGESGSSVEFETGISVATAHARDLASSLSSGTIKGANIIQRAIDALRTGGYLLVDEIENHLNKQLVGMIIDLFEANDTNPHGATLLFSTHYPEILDYLKRKDNVYFLVRGEEHSVSAIRYSDRVKRIENKKSEVFLANYIAGTAPRYADVAELKSFIKRAVRGDGNA